MNLCLGWRLLLMPPWNLLIISSDSFCFLKPPWFYCDPGWHTVAHLVHWPPSLLIVGYRWTLLDIVGHGEEHSLDSHRFPLGVSNGIILQRWPFFYLISIRLSDEEHHHHRHRQHHRCHQSKIRQKMKKGNLIDFWNKIYRNNITWTLSWYTTLF